MDRKGSIIAVASLIAAVAIAGCRTRESNRSFMTGMAETNEIDVSAKVPGRIDRMQVDEGVAVRKGDTLAILESTELDARVGQARGALAAARARSELALTGLRPQEKEAAEQLYLQAKAQADLMEKTWDRVSQLAHDSVISTQERDQVEAQYLAAKESMSAAKARLDMAREGSRSEDKAAAAALSAQAAQALAEAEAWRNERVLLSPIGGEVAKRIACPGEIVGAGAPVLTLIDPDDIWVVLTVKETDMARFRLGSSFAGQVPALGDTSVSLTVTYIAPMGEFATWRPTSQKGGFDVKTFEIHLKPIAPVNGLRAGMSVRVKTA